MNDAELERLAKQAGATLFLVVRIYRDALSRFADAVVASEGEQWRKVILQRDRELRRDLDIASRARDPGAGGRGMSENVVMPREVLGQALEALEIGYESASVEAAQYHAAMAGYRPERHAAMDADVAKIAAAITTLRAALA